MALVLLAVRVWLLQEDPRKLASYWNTHDTLALTIRIGGEEHMASLRTSTASFAMAPSFVIVLHFEAMFQLLSSSFGLGWLCLLLLSSGSFKLLGLRSLV